MIGVYTNTTFVDAYRGAGRPEATYVVERAMDLFADEIGMDPAAIRRKNFLPNDAFPYDNPSGLGTAVNGEKIYIDSGNYEPALDKALTMVDYYLLDEKRAEARKRGKLLGVGLSTYIEVCGVAPSKWIGAVGEGWGAAMWESANLKVHLTGKIILTMGTQPQGQGHETTYAQIISSELGVPMEDVIVQHSDTLGTPFGYGSYGSRTSSVGSTAAIKAAGKVREKAKRYAAHMLEANVEDIEVDGANYSGQGLAGQGQDASRRSRSRSISASASPTDMEPYLDETAYHDTPNCTFPFGTHIAIVEIDEETGKVDLVRYVAVDDVGNKINPMIVDGQLHGGIAQGVGQALWEGAIYSDDGQLQSGSMMDYAVPRASWFPNLELDETVTPSPVNPLGVKGVGEAGAIASTAAVANAVIDALSPLGHPATSTCPTRPDRLAGDPGREGRRRDGRRRPNERLEREGRPGMIPAAFDYTRPTSLDEAVAAVGKRRQGDRRGPQHPAAAQAAGRRSGSAHRHRSHRGAEGLPVAARWRRRDRGPDDLRRVAGGNDRPGGGRGDRLDRRRPGPQPRARSAVRSPTPIRRPTRRRSPSRTAARPFSAGRVASGSSRWMASSRGRSQTGIRDDEILVSIRRPAVPDGAGFALSEAQQPASGYSIVGVAALDCDERRQDLARRHRRDRRPRASVPGRGRRGGAHRHRRERCGDRGRGRPRDRRGRDQQRHPRRRRVPRGDGRGLHEAGHRGRSRPLRPGVPPERATRADRRRSPRSGRAGRRDPDGRPRGRRPALVEGPAAVRRPTSTRTGPS